MTQQALVALGWVFIGYCGRCRIKKEQWINPLHPGWQLKLARRLGSFALYENNICQKAGDFKLLTEYLKTMHEEKISKTHS